MWKDEPVHVRDYYRQLANKERSEHQLQYPEYRYSPRRPGEKPRRMRRHLQNTDICGNEQDIKPDRNINYSDAAELSVRSPNLFREEDNLEKAGLAAAGVDGSVYKSSFEDTDHHGNVAQDELFSNDFYAIQYSCFPTPQNYDPVLMGKLICQSVFIYITNIANASIENQ